jgi:DNA-binding transcriptional regulator YiaG
MPSKPASKPLAKALPREGGKFRAQWAMPGLIPDYVRDADGKPLNFPSERQAVAAAKMYVFDYLSTRLVDSRKNSGGRMLSPAEFAVALDRANITPTYFAEIYGTTQERVVGWLEGKQDIPHVAHLVVRGLQLDNFFKLAEWLIDWRETTPPNMENEDGRKKADH